MCWEKAGWSVRECLNWFFLLTAQAFTRFSVFHLYLSPPHAVCGVCARIHGSEIGNHLCGPNSLYRIRDAWVVACRIPYIVLSPLSGSRIIDGFEGLRAQFLSECHWQLKCLGSRRCK